MEKEEFLSKLKKELSEKSGFYSLGQLLQELKISKKEIAKLLGFSENAKMSAIFKKVDFAELNKKNDQIRLKITENQETSTESNEAKIEKTQFEKSTENQLEIKEKNQNLA